MKAMGFVHNSNIGSKVHCPATAPRLTPIAVPPKAVSAAAAARCSLSLLTKSLPSPPFLEQQSHSSLIFFLRNSVGQLGAAAAHFSRFPGRASLGLKDLAFFVFEKDLNNAARTL
ncbi:unnamed protein product [Citrullus colocynthis]|uniref:Uncharacterized protein n=1 Tax=Citrullus colocynthis TaxID=252529 RepID=A0ABP0Z5B2_9ROSI